MFLHILPYVSTIYSLGLTNRVTPTSLISELHKGSSQSRNATGRNVKQVFVLLSLATWGPQQLCPAAPAQPASCSRTRALHRSRVTDTCEPAPPRALHQPPSGHCPVTALARGSFLLGWSTAIRSLVLSLSSPLIKPYKFILVSIRVLVCFPLPPLSLLFSFLFFF